MDDGIWCHLSIGRSRWWGMRRQYPVNCKAICSDHPLLDHNWPGHQGDDIGVMVDSVMVDSVTMDSVMVDSVMVDGGRWWQEQTSALQQEISSRSSPPSHPTWKFVISTQLKLKLGRTRIVFRFWSRSRGRTTIGCLCSELAPCSTCQTKPIQNIFWNSTCQSNPMQNWPNLVFKTRPVQVELAHVCLVSKYQTRSPLSRLASPCCRVLDPSK